MRIEDFELLNDERDSILAQVSRDVISVLNNQDSVFLLDILFANGAPTDEDFKIEVHRRVSDCGFLY